MNDTRRSELEQIIQNYCPIKHEYMKEELERWADRWAGRPSRAAIRNLLSSDLSYDGTTDAILALYPAPTSERKRVSRTEIKEILFDEADWLSAEAADSIAGSLLALIGVEEEYVNFSDKSKRLIQGTPILRCLHDGCNLWKGHDRTVEEKKPIWCKCMDEYNYITNWKFCPFCGAPRPVEKGRGEG